MKKEKLKNKEAHVDFNSLTKKIYVDVTIV